MFSPAHVSPLMSSSKPTEQSQSYESRVLIHIGVQPAKSAAHLQPSTFLRHSSISMGKNTAVLVRALFDINPTAMIIIIPVNNNNNNYCR